MHPFSLECPGNFSYTEGPSMALRRRPDDRPSPHAAADIDRLHTVADALEGMDRDGPTSAGRTARRWARRCREVADELADDPHNVASQLAARYALRKAEWLLPEPEDGDHDE